MSVSEITTPVTENELIGKVNELISKSNNICAFTFDMEGEVESSSVGLYDLTYYDATITPPSGFRYEPANYDYTLVIYPYTKYLTLDARSGGLVFNNNSIYVHFYGNRYKTRGNPSFVALLIESEKSSTSATYKKPIMLFPPNSLPTAGFFQATSGSTLNADGYYETTIGLARPANRPNATYPVMIAVLNDGHAANYANYAIYTYNNSGVTFTLYTKSPSTTSDFYVCCIDADAQMVDFSNTFGSGSKVPTNGTENIASSATFTGADGTNAGSKGLVPAPTATDNDKFLKGDGTWGTLSGANTDLSNLTSTGQNIANWSSNVTNCITEIQQDIKLELDNGTLTLKAGSKLYTGTGTSMVLDDDVGIMAGSGTAGTNFILISADGYDDIVAVPITSTSYTYNSNTGYVTNGTTDYYLPVAVATRSTTGYTSIDQVFNGFGYIGSTVFALPGVKGLIPDGRNADGSLKSIEFTTSSVLVNTYSSANGFFVLRINNGTTINATTSVIYNEDENYIYISGTIYPSVVIGNVVYSSGKITSFIPKTIFHALDYNDSSTISGWSMPSTRYTDLTLGASGATYTAPANGWFCLNKVANAANQYATFRCNNRYSRAYSPSNGAAAELLFPAKKGDVVSLLYTLGGTLTTFNFIYAEGEQ